MTALNLILNYHLKYKTGFSCFCVWFVKSILISQFVDVFNAKGKQFQIHIQIDALKIHVIFFCTYIFASVTLILSSGSSGSFVFIRLNIDVGR